jgi:hypothetical protein
MKQPFKRDSYHEIGNQMSKHSRDPEKERDSSTGREEDQLSWTERKLLWLQIKLAELIPDYTDGVAQEEKIKMGDIYQDGLGRNGFC